MDMLSKLFSRSGVATKKFDPKDLLQIGFKLFDGDDENSGYLEYKKEFYRIRCYLVDNEMTFEYTNLHKLSNGDAFPAGEHHYGVADALDYVRMRLRNTDWKIHIKYPVKDISQRSVFPVSNSFGKMFHPVDLPKPKIEIRAGFPKPEGVLMNGIYYRTCKQ
jgi:hypothetical protein